MKNIKTVTLANKCEHRVMRGYLWVFSNEIMDNLKDYKPGEPVKVIRNDGRFLGIGYINPHSLIAIRILTYEERMPDREFFEDKIKAAHDRRLPFIYDRSVYRIVFSEGDLLPGLIIDRYDQYIVIQSTTVGMDQYVSGIAEAIQNIFKPAAILFRNDRVIQEKENYIIRRDVLDGVYPGPVEVNLGALKFRVDLLTGQKTGLYLDQLPHYPYMKNIARNANVLDTCCYTGGFAVHAAHHGAAHVVGIDISDEALITARINADLNGYSEKCQFYKGSAFDALKNRVINKEQYDVIILDPPSFARSKNKSKQALKGYKELHIKSMRLLKPAGYLLTFSCSHHVPEDRFYDTIARAARDTRKSFQVIHRFNQPPDHPSLLTMHETRYFKGLLLRQM